MTTVNRRDFLKVAGVTAAAGAVACDPRVPTEKVLPYVVQPEQIVPGVPTFFATQCNECSANCGIIARNREGRVVKLEGNPQHPGNQGRTCAMGQQGLQATYSPDRFNGPMVAGAEKSWDEALSAVTEALKAAQGGGKKVAWLGHARSGATGALISTFLAAFGAKPYYWEPLSGAVALRAATREVFGLDKVPAFDLASAHTIVSFGAEFLSTWGGIDLARAWGDSRDPAMGGFVSRTVCVEPRLGNTSVNTDLHLAAKPGTEAPVAMALARLVAEKRSYSGAAAGLVAGVDVAAAVAASGVSQARLEEVAGWMAANPSVALPGGVHTSGDLTNLAVATLILNEVAGAVGSTLHFGNAPTVQDWVGYQDVASLITDLAAGNVGVLFLDGSDPVYNLPAELKAAEALAKTTLVSFANESNDSLTSSAIVLPPGTTLEAWGDAEARRHWHTLQQATMMPLKSSRQIGDVLLQLAKSTGKAVATPVAAPVETAPASDSIPASDSVPAAAPTTDAAAAPVEAVPVAPVLPSLPGLDAPDFATWLKGWWKAMVWTKAGMVGSFDTFWVQSLQMGGWFGPEARSGAPVVLSAAPAIAASEAAGAGEYSLLLFAHPFIYDGRHANRPWAQEVPEPVSSFTWGTWVEIHPKTAEKLGLGEKDSVIVKTDQGSLEVGWFGSPGIREDAVAIVIGGGHSASGRYATFGKNANSLIVGRADRGGEQVFSTSKASISKGTAGGNLHPYLGHMNTDGRGVNFAVSVKDLGKGDKPAAIVPMHHVPIDERITKAGLTDMYPEPEHPTYRFALAIDLNRCTGCGACETACFAENNNALVGPDQVRKGRHMGWIRLGRYWETDGETPDIRFQPTMCQHCSHAPCEGVCPVLATYHNLDGLNAMVYNRCVGTRYCGNNCPYTARRFNYHSYKWPESFHLMLNPEVSTREMGVMEKCTFCVQRLRSAKDTYRDSKEIVPESALLKLTACAQACPSEAITFGNLNDKEGTVYKLFQDERAYAMLGELNNKPGVRYLAKINHLESKLHGHGGHGGGHAAEGGDHGGSSGEHH